MLVDPPDSYRELCDSLGLSAGIPYVKDWSAAEDFIRLITDHVRLQQPAVIVECGSGLTTLMLASACDQTNRGHIYSLENSAQHAHLSREAIAAYNLTDHATVIDAPLIGYQLDDKQYQWYSMDELPDSKVDMLVIDGPPGRMQPHARYPAMPLLGDRLAECATIFMDDAARPDEIEVVDWWLTQYPGLSNEYLDTERGCSRLLLNNH